MKLLIWNLYVCLCASSGAMQDDCSSIFIVEDLTASHHVPRACDNVFGISKETRSPHFFTCLFGVAGSEKISISSSFIHIHIIWNLYNLHGQNTPLCLEYIVNFGLTLSVSFSLFHFRFRLVSFSFVRCSWICGLHSSYLECIFFFG